MEAPAGAAIRLADYRPPEFLIDFSRLRFDLDPERTIVRNAMSIRRAPGTPKSAPLRLDGLRLELVSLSLDGAEVGPGRFERSAGGLTVSGVPDAFTLEVVTALAPAQNKSGHGLFYIAGNLATQCEPQGFRQMTYFIDRPDNPCRFNVTLAADRTAFPVLLSNGNLVAKGELEGGRHWAEWDDPFPKPTYIFAVAAGDFAVLADRFVTRSGRKVNLGIYASRATIGSCGFAMEAVKRSLVWDEETFGLEYDLSDYNIVALDGWGGAMENKGLNLFGSNGIVTDPETTTDDDYLLIERIIGHEQFHNWTGNRVTCRDWFQLSLKEGLTRLRDQLFISAKTGPGAWRIENVKGLRRNQFPEDDGPAAHSIQPALCVTVNSFYTGTIYEKGAEVVRMIMTLLGWEAFRKGFDLYIARHDGQAVTTEDFVAAMEDASGVDLKQFRRWYTQAGRPTVEAAGRYDAAARRYTLTLSQSCRTVEGMAAPQPFHIPVGFGLVGPDGAALAFTDAAGRRATDAMLSLTEARQDFVFNGVDAPPTPSLLRRFSAPVSLKTTLGDADLALLMTHDTDPFGRWDASQTLATRIIRTMSAERAAGRPMHAPDGFIAAFGATLRDDDIGHLLKSQILWLVDEPALSDGLAEIDLDGHVAARTMLRVTLATRFSSELLETYRALKEDGPFAVDRASIGRRRLKNACLDLLMALNAADIADLALAQATGGTNMTDRYEALAMLANSEAPQREEALAHFRARWKDNTLAIDKWFMAQALSRAPGAVQRIIALKSDPLMDADNQVRAQVYYGSFFRQNRVAFHDPSGAGYGFLADRLIEMDRMGRQRSHWMMPQINMWRRYDPARRALMRGALERIAATPGVSASLAENVRRALEN